MAILSPLDLTVCAIIATLITADGRGSICPDDERIYRVAPWLPEQVRRSILRLVDRGIFAAGDGYLREGPNG